MSNFFKSEIQRLWKSLLILSYVLLSYYTFGGWWNSSVGSLLIILFSYFIWRNDFLKVVGLKFNIQTGIKSIILAGIVTLCSFYIINQIAENQDITIQLSNWRNYYHDVFYILNEEIVLGAILLYTLVNKKKVNPLIASVVLAIAFSIIHYVFYRWIFDDRGIIELSTLITLFFIGFVRNNLILYTGHIGYSWALHFGWIVVMFGCQHLTINSDLYIHEPERFNIYLGSTEMVFISLFLAIVSLLFWIKCNRKITVL